MNFRERAEKLMPSSNKCEGCMQIEKLEAFAREIEAETIERCAEILDKREQCLQTATGNTYYQQVECNIMARSIRALKEKP